MSTEGRSSAQTFSTSWMLLVRNSSNGVLSYWMGTETASRLLWFDRQGRQLGQVGQAALWGGTKLSPDGKLLAINTNRIGDGFDLARPADAAFRERVDALSRGESVSRPRLGIAVAPSIVARRLRRSVGLAERDGLLVRGVEDGSPADRAGIREGDLLVEAAGRPLTAPSRGALARSQASRKLRQCKASRLPILSRTNAISRAYSDSSISPRIIRKR